MKDNKTIAKEARKNILSSKSALSKQYNNTRQCQAFYAGNAMSYKDSVQFSTVSGKKKAQVQFNHVKPYVNSVKGFMAQNRREGKYIARDESPMLQKQYSLYANSLADYIRENCHADQVETQQDGDMLIAGYGAVDTALTYDMGYATTDPNGEVVMGRLDPLCLGWDPAAKEANLLDRRFNWYEQQYHIDEALELFEAEKDDFEKIEDEGDDYEYLPRGGNYDKYKEIVEWADEENQMVKVYFYEWYDIEKFYRAPNPVFSLTNPQAVQMAMMQLEMIASEIEDDENGLFKFDPREEVLVFDAAVKAKLSETFGEYIEIYEAPRKVFYKAIVSKNKVFQAVRSESQQGFTVKFKTGDYDAVNKIWTGMVNSMMEPQKYYNKALTELMFVIASNSKGGVLVEQSAVQDIRDFESRYAKTDGVVIVNDGALSGGQIQEKKSPFTPTGYENVVQLSMAAFSDVNGIDKSFLGSSENRMETATLQRQRIKQVVSTLACYFDAITLYQKEHARLLLDLMRVYAENNEGALFRVLGEKGAVEFVRLSKDKLMAEYDITIREAPQTQDEQSEFAKELIALADRLATVGDMTTAKVIYAKAIKYMGLDGTDVQDLTEILIPEDARIDPAYVQQLEQQLEQARSEMTSAQLGKLVSDALYNQARAEETAAKTAKTLEEAAQRGIENDLIRGKSSADVNVTI